MPDPDTHPPSAGGVTAQTAWKLLLDRVDRADTSLDGEETSHLVRLVRASGEEEFVDAALPLLQDRAPARRRLAARVLGSWNSPDTRSP